MPSTHSYDEIFNLSSVESNYYEDNTTRTVHPENTTILRTDISFYNNTNRTDVYFEIPGKCHDWQDAQHALFQLANLCMVVSFLTPSSFRHHIFFIRFMMSFGFVFFVLWAGFFICMPDMLAWNGAFFLINLGFVIYLGYHVVPARYNKDLEDLYIKVFKPLRITPQEFRDLSEIGEVDILTKGSIYAKEKITNSGEKFSILLKGRLKVTYERLFLHHIDINQFVDSPEFDSHTEDNEADKYQISIVAVDDSLLLTWPYDELREHLKQSETVAPIFNQLIGKDVSYKLYQIQELLLSNPNYMLPLSSHQSSMVNLRTSLMNQNSGNNTRVNSFGFDMKNLTLPLEESFSTFAAETFETQV